MIKKSGSAKWTGNLKEGKGHVSTQTGVISDQPYGFNTRFEGKDGTNPEELIGAAHASCFSMALSMILEDYDLVADSIETKATVFLEQKDGGFHVPRFTLMWNVSSPTPHKSSSKRRPKPPRRIAPSPN